MENTTLKDKDLGALNGLGGNGTYGKKNRGMSSARPVPPASLPGMACAAVP